MKKIIIVILLFSLLIAENFNTTLVGSSNNGGCQSIQLIDSLIFYGLYPELRVSKLVKPYEMTLINKINAPYPILDLEINNECAYMCDYGSSVGVIDFSNFSLLFERSVIPIIHTVPRWGPTWVVALESKNDILYIGEAYVEGLQVYDISNPSIPIKIGQYDSSKFHVKGLEINGDYAYIASGYHGGGLLNIINISDPSNPSYVNSYGTGQDITSVTVRNGYAYIVDQIYDSEQPTGLYILDISDPYNITELSFYDVPGWQHQCVEVDDKYAYVGDRETGLHIFNIEDPENIEYSGCYGPTGIADIEVNGCYIYIASAGVQIIRNDLEYIPPFFVNVDSVSAFPGDTISFGVNVVFPPDSSYNSFSISFDNEMGKLSFLGIDTTHTLVGNAGWNLEYENDVNLKIFSENNQLPISGEGILIKLNFSIPDTLHWGDFPLNINSITFDDSDHEVEITNGNLFIKRIIVYGDVNLDSVVSDSDAVMILKYLLNEEIFNEQQLLNADVSLKSGVSALDASLILQYNAGVIDTLPYELFNDSILTDCVFKMDPDSVRLGAQITVPIFTESSENIFSFSGRFEYDQSYLNLNEVVWYDTNETFIFVKEHSTDKVNFVGAGRSALGIRDIFATMEFTANETFYYIYTYVDLERMRMNEQSVTYNIARAVIWKDITGITDINLPEFVALDENCPNPFNPITTIEYELPEAQNIKLQIFDITGRLVETLYNGFKEAGHWDVTWNASDQSSGVYIYHLQVGDKHISRKMLLLK